MNITLELQQLDDLIVKHTKPPVTTMLRNKLHPLREQLEAYISENEQGAELHRQRAKRLEELEAANLNLRAQITRRDTNDPDGFAGLGNTPIPGI